MSELRKSLSRRSPSTTVDPTWQRAPRPRAQVRSKLGIRARFATNTMTTATTAIARIAPFEGNDEGGRGKTITAKLGFLRWAGPFHKRIPSPRVIAAPRKTPRDAGLASVPTARSTSPPCHRRVVPEIPAGNPLDEHHRLQSEDPTSHRAGRSNSEVGGERPDSEEVVTRPRRFPR